MEPASAAPRAGKSKSACDLCRIRKVQPLPVIDSINVEHVSYRSAVIESSLPARTVILRGCPAHLPLIRLSGRASSSEFRQHPTRIVGTRLIDTRELADTQARVEELEAALRAARESSGHTENLITVPLVKSFSSTPESLVTQPPKNVNFVPDTHSPDAALAAFRWHLEYCGLGSALSTTRAAFSSEIYRRTGCSFDLDDFFSDLVDSFHSQGLGSIRLATTAKWPPAPLVQRCVKNYAKSGLYSLFPFADADALQMLLDAGVLNHPQSTRAANRAVLIAFTANVTQMHRHDPAFQDTEPDAYAQAALSLLPEILMETPDLRTLEAVNMLVSLPIAFLSTVQTLIFVDARRPSTYAHSVSLRQRNPCWESRYKLCTTWADTKSERLLNFRVVPNITSTCAHYSGSVTAWIKNSRFVRVSHRY